MTTNDDIREVMAAADTLETRLTRRRRCPKCAAVKPLVEFAGNKSKPQGKGYYCLPCQRDSSRAYRSTDAGKLANREAAKRSRDLRAARA